MPTYTPCSCLVFNMKGYLLGAPLPLHSLPTQLTLMSSTFAKSTWLILEFLFQKRLTIQGKIVDMHYSNSRNKYEDWLCNTVSYWSLLVSWSPCLTNAVAQYCTHTGLEHKLSVDLCVLVYGTPTLGIAGLVRLYQVSMLCCIIGLLSQHCSGLIISIIWTVTFSVACTISGGGWSASGVEQPKLVSS